jgi:hypothetical protein
MHLLKLGAILVGEHEGELHKATEEGFWDWSTGMISQPTQNRFLARNTARGGTGSLV